MIHVLQTAFAISFSAALLGQAPERAVHGTVDDSTGIRIVRVWGEPEERGFAHGKLLGAEIADLIRAEYRALFRGDERLLKVGRQMLGRMITYPETVEAELGALLRGMRAAGADMELDGFDRELDLDDLRFVNALDVFASMGCSGFTAWGDMVEGGGVLTTRNFDWPVSGRHMVDSLIVLVQQPSDGVATASATWPGYLGVVTGVSADGYTAFLHEGSGERAQPEPDSMPTATAASVVLRHGERDDFVAFARRTLDETSPPSSFITRFVMPRVPADRDFPIALFEADTRRVVEQRRAKPSIVTNHFFLDEGGNEGCGRYQEIDELSKKWLSTDDERISIDEAWEALRAVDVTGTGFATLHSLVFRAEPWHFELAVGVVKDGEVVAAPRTERRYVLTREQLFGKEQ